MKILLKELKTSEAGVPISCPRIFHFFSNRFQVPDAPEVPRLATLVAQHTSPTDTAYNLIAQAAPERHECLDAFWKEHSVCFKVVEGKSGITLNANKDRVKFACKDLQVMWLLGFSLWKSIELFSPAVVMSKIPGIKFSSVIENDDRFDDLRYRYNQRIAAVLDLIEGNVLDPQMWPPDIPSPFESREDLEDPQDIAAFDLVIMATAVLFLHELKHVEFHARHTAGNPRPDSPAVEELQCDEWARDWFMAGIADYARVSKHPYQKVYSKRAMALLLVCEYLRLAKQHAGLDTSSKYPSLAERTTNLLKMVDLPDDDNFWKFATCILFAETMRQGIVVKKIDSMSTSKQIVNYLLDVLKS